MERHGIWYFFEHGDGRHTLVMVDTPAGHHANSGAPALPYLPAGAEPHREQVHGPWVSERLFCTSRPALASDGGGQDADHRRYAGGNAVSLFPGSLVAVERHPVTAENRTFLVVRCSHRFAPRHGRIGGGEPAYEGSYEFQPGDRPFPLPPVTPKPQIAGVQMAKVAAAPGGPADAIRIDENGCIPVQFPWDRARQSCLVRIAHAWSGDSRDAPFIPRAGAEVVVAFLDGDPDRPLVTGCIGMARSAHAQPGGPGIPGASPVPLPGKDAGETPAVPGAPMETPVRIAAQTGPAGAAESSSEGPAGDPACTDEICTDETRTDETWTASANRTWTIKGDDTTTIQFGDQTVNIAFGNHTVNALQSITLNVCLGSSFLAITPDAVTIKSPVINLTADTMINLNAPLTAVPGGPVIIVPGPLTGFGVVVPPAGEES
jgi:type VI secretion system secreted protein VgrG